MKKFILFIVLLFGTSLVFATGPYICDTSIHATMTKGQIEAMEHHTPNNPSTTIFLDFEGLGNDVPIGNYYNGGAGPNYGVYFSSNTLALIDGDAGGSGNFANEPSPSTVMFFLTGASAIMDVPAGFTTGFSFYYTSSGPVTLYVYDGLDGTGNLLASQAFPTNYMNDNCTGDPNGAFCHWDVVGVTFSGTAKSVSFSGAENQCGFDNVTFGSSTPGPGPNPIPTLSQWGLIIFGIILLGFGTVYILRRRGLFA